MRRTNEEHRPVSALTIAGSDSGGGAGIQADLKAFAAHGVHGLSAIAALTAQSTRGVTAVHVPPVSFLRAQLDVLFGDFRIGVVKLGMLANAEVIDTVADVLAAQPASLPVVLDPVMVATSGARLLDPAALEALRTRLLPRATLVTPNIPEAEWLLGRSIASAADADAALLELQALGARAVLLKGGHLPGTGPMVDRLAEGSARAHFEHPRLALEGHGTGCTLASAIAAHLALGRPLHEACERAAAYVHGALRHAYRPGLGHASVLGHFWECAAAAPTE
jgi:hydroxymethylpyrimidine/phosphomethylpyrimidine kinase